MEIVICEDNPVHAQGIAAAVRRLVPAADIRTFSSARALLEELSRAPRAARVVLMDIELERRDSGIRAAQRINELDADIPIVFITGDIGHATEIGRADSVYFVTKPVREDQLRLALEKARASLAHASVALALRGRRVLLAQREILYAERRLRSTFVHAACGALQVSETPESLLRRLDARFFAQCHKSFVVNLRRVRTIAARELCLDEGTVLPVSRSFSGALREALAGYLGERLA